jgi:hypothetical protein
MYALFSLLFMSSLTVHCAGLNMLRCLTHVCEPVSTPHNTTPPLMSFLSSLGSKAIFHLEAFAARFMQLYVLYPPAFVVAVVLISLAFAGTSSSLSQHLTSTKRGALSRCCLLACNKKPSIEENAQA